MSDTIPKVERWIDLYSSEFELLENFAWIRRFTLRAIDLNAVVIDTDGRLFMLDKITPIHAELGKQLVGLRYSNKAMN